MYFEDWKYVFKITMEGLYPFLNMDGQTDKFIELISRKAFKCADTEKEYKLSIDNIL